METVRKEILPGVWLTALENDKFKTGCLSISLLTQLDRETAAMNALIPYVLRRGSRNHTDMQALATELDGLYGSYIEPVVRKIGEIQCIGFLASFADDKYLPNGSGVFESIANLCGEILLAPCTKGGLLLPEYVDSEKEKLLDSIKSRLNDKRSWALQRLIDVLLRAVCRIAPRHRGHGGKYILSETHQALPQPYHDLPDRDLLLRQPRRGRRCREALGCVQRHAQRRDRL